MPKFRHATVGQRAAQIDARGVLEPVQFEGSSINVNLTQRLVINKGGVYSVQGDATPQSGTLPYISVITTERVTILGNFSTLNTTNLPAAGSIIDVMVGGRISVQNLNFLGPAGNTQTVLSANACKALQFLECTVDTYNKGVVIQGASRGLEVVNCNFYNVTRDIEQLNGGSCDGPQILFNRSFEILGGGATGHHVYLRGSCTNILIQGNVCKNKHVYVYNCFGDTIQSNVGYDDANGATDEIFILSGGDATPSAPTLPGADVGCSNCLILNNKYQQATTAAGGSFAGSCVVCLYCKNCTIKGNKSYLNDATQTSVAAHFAGSYCEGCNYYDNEGYGLVALGIYSCDFYGVNVACKDTNIIGNKIADAYQGISLLRCSNALIENNHSSRAATAFVVSEGATQTVLKDNTAQGCTVQGLYNGIWAPATPGLFAAFSDAFLQPPVNTNLINNSFHNTTGGIVEPVVTVKTGYNVVN